MYGDTWMAQVFNAANPNGTNAAPKGSQASTASTGQSSMGNASVLAPVALVTVAIVYLIWAAVQQHERVRESLAPANIAVNFHNLFVMFLTVWLSFKLVQIALAKAALWHIPGAQGALGMVSI